MTIHVKGLYASTIEFMNKSTVRSHLTPDCFENFLKEHGQVGEASWEPGFYPAFAHVLIAGMWIPPQHWMGEPPSQRHPARSQRMDAFRIAKSTMKGRTCFFTNSRQFGIGPDSVQQGDILISLPGSSSLMALRPEDNSKNLTYTVPKMTLVGNCFVHGLPTQQQQGNKGLSEYLIV
jgi:hypothetical protein